MNRAMQRPAGLAVIFVTIVIDVIGIGIVFPIVPKLVEEILGGRIASAAFVYGWLIATYSVFQFLCSPILGALSDRFGRRPIILVSLFGLALDYLVLVFADSVFWLVVARIVGGALSASIATAAAYIADISPPERRAQSFGLIGVAFGIGFIAGPFLGGLLGEYSARLPFVAGIVLSLGAAAYAYFFLPESLAPENRKSFRLRNANPVSAFTIVTRYPTVLGIVGSFVFANLAERMLESIWVLYAGYRFAWGPADVGLSLAAVGVLFVISQGLLVRIVVPWLGEWRVITIGLVFGAVALVLYGLATEGWMMYAIAVVHILGWSTAGPALQALATRAVPANEQGLLQGVVNSVVTATGVVGAPIAATAFGFFIGPNAPFILPGIAFFIGAALFLVALAVTLRVRARLPPAEKARLASPEVA
jgi:DHA1 family tetracycline resistance protein-like MFS transporter